MNKPGISFKIAGFLLIALLAYVNAGTSPALADTVAASVHSDTSKSFWDDIEITWGGYIKCRGVISWPDNDSYYSLAGTGTYYDGSVDGRLKSRYWFGSSVYLDIHHEIILSGGDTRRKQKELEKIFAGTAMENFLSGEVTDDRRLIDFTKTLKDSDNYTLYHCLDRLSLTLQQRQWVFRVGRQAVTWGNGFLFNPMDLFNPFAHTDIEREYKIGDDMAHAQISFGESGDAQFLYVPRRDPSTGKIEGSQDSLAGKVHFSKGTTEFDIMAAKHFQEQVVGVGCLGYLGDAAWRLDATWIFPDEQSDESKFISLVANMDYSWVWWNKNFYGFAEVFYNGLGNDNCSESVMDTDIMERLNRGEIFTLGRYYMGWHVRMEAHPLVNIFFTVIDNMDDSSGILQPRITWDITQSLQITCGGNIFCGGRDTEYGGFKIPPSDTLIKTPDSAYIWLAWYF
ncbi:MAG: hypothetical protein U9N38_01270 [Thermodesulfobacteriota bacterium]|nr:hypothetical protein [Thermodesulfobacteriota bacterium]